MAYFHLCKDVRTIFKTNILCYVIRREIRFNFMGTQLRLSLANQAYHLSIKHSIETHSRNLNSSCNAPIMADEW